MREIGVRRLKASLSETLRAVSAGEHVRITVHGRAVAELVPPGAGAGRGLHDLVAAGRLSLPTSPRSPRPPKLAQGCPSATAVVLGDRDAEP